jgi:hypothetical protein
MTSPPYFNYSRSTVRRTIFLTLVLNIAFLVICFTPVSAADPPNPEAGKAIGATMDGIWQDLLLGDGNQLTLFSALCKSLTGIAILAIGWETAYMVAKSKSIDNPRSFLEEFVFEKMLPTLLIVAALSNNGYIAGNMLYASKNIFLGIDRVAYESLMFKAGTAGLATVQKDAGSVITPVSDSFTNCYSIPDRIEGKPNPVLIQCLQRLGQKIDTAIASGKIQDAQLLTNLNKSRGIINTAISSDNPSSELIKAGSVFRRVATISDSGFNPFDLKGDIEAIINTILYGIGLVFYIVIEIVFLILAVASSIVLMLSIYKIDVLLKFLPQFMNVFVAKLSYTIAMAISLIIQSKAGSDLGTWGIGILTGLGCPFISIGIMLALSGSINSVFERTAINAAAGGYRAAGKAAGGAAQGAKWLGGKMAGKMGSRGAGGASSAAGGVGGTRQLTGGSRAGSGGGQIIDVVARRV